VKARLVKCLPKTAELVGGGTDHHHTIHNELAIAVNSRFDIHKSQLDATVQVVVVYQLPRVYIAARTHACTP
jgi:hypothetical protein